MTIETSPAQVKYEHGHHPNSRKNLKPFKPGSNGDKPGNGYSLTAALKDTLRKSPKLREKLITSTIEGAILREPAPFHEVWDRVDGRIADDKANITAIQINIVYDKPDIAVESDSL